MAIARKPKKADDKSQVDVDALINKGGSVAKLAESTSPDEAATEGRAQGPAFPLASSRAPFV